LNWDQLPIPLLYNLPHGEKKDAERGLLLLGYFND
jgi:hypothetical protein